MNMKYITVELILHLLIQILNIDFILTATSNDKHKLLLITFDGFRWDYLKYMDTPNFNRFLSSGTRTPYMNGVFPSSTIPSLYSVATGLYPESHGLIDNEMYDPHLKATFNYTTTDSVWYEKAEPIWITAKKQGLKTACYYYPGTDAEIHGYRPDIWIPYDLSTKLEDKVDQAIKWFTKDDVDFVNLYFPQPDHIAHATGPAPESSDTVVMIERCDQTLGYLLTEIEKYNLTDKVNMILLSDHGFTNVYPNKTIELYKHVDQRDIEVFLGHNILPVEGKTLQVYNALKHVSNLTVYLKDEVPEYFHYKHNDRILPIVLIPDEGYSIIENISAPMKIKGSHGFDNRLMSMKPFFAAMGPDIKVGFESDVFSQIDVYPLMCNLLGITPQPKINGSLETTGQMTRNFQLSEHSDPEMDSMSSIMLVAITGFGTLLCVLVLGVIYIVIKQRLKLNSTEITYSKIPTDYISL